ncbi:hypothetical protein SIN8267_01619 [Sinobacterium norvegicum]|uniref:Outer membrane lipoprotein carrier protein LolA n=1 Tax=Sinobacterium norvegicum TaxID=1641715 RepID=A0ABM9AEN9_9GAMM|nr:outer membrane lipoprotein carrier protein LolA [Sinobacterium norvegicum]CAH0991513.1 hypothetical protein SIN8267_01619 [Sinobacterium norvegicum]
MRCVQCILLLLLSPFIGAEPYNIELQRRFDVIADQIPLAGRFEQTKTMPMLSRPLITQGAFLIDAEHQLFWLQKTPFSSKLCIKQQYIAQQVAGGEVQISTSLENPLMFNALSFITALMSGDMAAIQTNFTPVLKGDVEHWEIMLTPKQPPFTGIFTTIDVAGHGDVMQSIQLNERRGDSTLIVFSQLLLNNADIAQQWPEEERVWCQ